MAINCKTELKKLPGAFRSFSQLIEILGCLWQGIAIKAHYNGAFVLATDGNVEIHLKTSMKRNWLCAV